MGQSQKGSWSALASAPAGGWGLGGGQGRVGVGGSKTDKARREQDRGGEGGEAQKFKRQVFTEHPRIKISSECL